MDQNENKNLFDNFGSETPQQPPSSEQPGGEQPGSQLPYSSGSAQIYETPASSAPEQPVYTSPAYTPPPPPPPPAAQPPKRNTTMIIIIVVVALLLLCCCCLAAVGIYLYQNGDEIFDLEGTFVPMIQMLV